MTPPAGDAPRGPWSGPGNHRLVVVAPDAGIATAVGCAPAVRADFERRWRDPRPPGRRGVIVVAEATGQVVSRWGIVEGEGVDVAVYFEPVAGPGRYAVYPLPVDAVAVAHYPADSFTELPNPDPAWLAGHREGAPAAEVLGWEHRSAHHGYDEMELRATDAELAGVTARWRPEQLIVFAETADHPVRMRTAVPTRWLDRRPGEALEVCVAAGGRGLFQLALWAGHGDGVPGVTVTFAPRSGPDEAPTTAAAPGLSFTCFTLGGIDRFGHRCATTIDVPPGEIQSFWCGVQAPPGLAGGRYRTDAVVTGGGREAVVALTVLVTNPDASPAGANPIEASHDPDGPMGRLWWLDSTRGLGGGPTRGFTPVTAAGDTVEVLGRRVTLGPLGFPTSIVSRFSPDGASADGGHTEMLAGAVTLSVVGGDRRVLPWQRLVLGPRVEVPDGVGFSATAVAGPVTLDVHGRMEFDGTLSYEVELAAAAPVVLADVRLRLPLRREVTDYVMGLGVRGGRRPERIDWSWDTGTRNQDSVWVGVPHAGLQLSLRDERYLRPLNTNFYHRRPLRTPRSWANDGNGRVSIANAPGDDEVAVTNILATSGRRQMVAGERLRFDFRLTLTPFKPIDWAGHFAQRYYHRYVTPADALAAGATTINLHHATPPNPYLNFPFPAADELARFVTDAHQHGIAVKLYYTIRELSTRAAELWALLSLGEELFFPGPGGGQAWLQEHVDHPYLPGWYAAEVDDTTLITSGSRRWDNFYVEGLAWLAETTGIDGIYLDDVAFDREAMKRIRRTLEQPGGDTDIDLHSANQFNPADGYASSANLYLDLLPYLDRLWFGEYFDYAAGPDYWLIEVSGLPFGVTGEMLQDGGHPWRGMLYGMTSRLGLPEDADPRPIWALWDLVDITTTRMHGYWVADPPVTTGHEQVLATSYVGQGRTLVALASWAGQDVTVDLDVDWDRFGLTGPEQSLTLPTVSGLQEGRPPCRDRTVTVPAGAGAFVILGRPQASQQGRPADGDGGPR